jgi:hypothetical protein
LNSIRTCDRENVLTVLLSCVEKGKCSTAPRRIAHPVLPTNRAGRPRKNSWSSSSRGFGYLEESFDARPAVTGPDVQARQSPGRRSIGCRQRRRARQTCLASLHRYASRKRKVCPHCYPRPATGVRSDRRPRALDSRGNRVGCVAGAPMFCRPRPIAAGQL